MSAKTMPTHTGPTPKTNSAGAPNQSLYITNLPEKLQKQDLRLSLYTLFATYGPVLDVVALKTAKMRGQAHIVFRDIQTSTQAMRALQGFDFFGKEIRIQYAKSKSDVFTKLEGVYRPPTVAPATVISSELQQSIFNAPPSSTNNATSTPTVPTKLPTPPANGIKSDNDGLQGVKRRREDESDNEEAQMEEEEEDDDVSMEASSDED